MVNGMGKFAWVLSLLFVVPAISLAHEGHTHGEEPPEQATLQSGPVILTAEERKNLDIRTAEATVQPIERTVKASGIIEAIPGSRENVSSRIPGKVAQLTAALGEYKRKGEPLLILEARQLAEAPIRVPVTAPRNGKVVKIDVIKGNAVEPGTSLLELADYNEVYAVAKVYESQIGLIRKGMAARVHNPFLKGLEMDSKVEIIGSEVHPQSRTVEVWLRVKNPGERLKINMMVTVYFLADKADDAIAVPKMAVLGSGAEKFVFVVEGDNHTRTSVVTGIENDKWVEIVEGVAPGDVVVTQGNYQLQFAKPDKSAKPANQTPAK